MTYVNWDFGIPKLTSVKHTMCFLSPPSTTSGMYYQTYDFAIDGTGTYHGMQAAKGIGQQVIFSRFGTVDLSNVRLGTGAAQYPGTNEGPYVRILMKYPFGIGCYTVRVSRAEASGEADWFDMYVGPEGGTETFVGGIKFPRATAGVGATILNGGGSWVEDYSTESSIFNIPYTHITLKASAEANTKAIHANSNYSALPNSDIYYEAAKQLVHMELGYRTPRCTPAGQLF